MYILNENTHRHNKDIRQTNPQQNLKRTALLRHIRTNRKIVIITRCLVITVTCRANAGIVRKQVIELTLHVLLRLAHILKQEIRHERRDTEKTDT